MVQERVEGRESGVLREYEVSARGCRAGEGLLHCGWRRGHLQGGLLMVVQAGHAGGVVEDVLVVGRAHTVVVTLLSPDGRLLRQIGGSDARWGRREVATEGTRRRVRSGRRGVQQVGGPEAVRVPGTSAADAVGKVALVAGGRGRRGGGSRCGRVSELLLDLALERRRSERQLLVLAGGVGPGRGRRGRSGRCRSRGGSGLLLVHELVGV